MLLRLRPCSLLVERGERGGGGGGVPGDWQSGEEGVKRVTMSGDLWRGEAITLEMKDWERIFQLLTSVKLWLLNILRAPVAWRLTVGMLEVNIGPKAACLFISSTPQALLAITLMRSTSQRVLYFSHGSSIFGNNKSISVGANIYN